MDRHKNRSKVKLIWQYGGMIFISAASGRLKMEGIVIKPLFYSPRSAHVNDRNIGTHFLLQISTSHFRRLLKAEALVPSGISHIFSFGMAYWDCNSNTS